MNNNWIKKYPQICKIINVPPPTYISLFVINLPIIKHHKQQNLQRMSLENNNRKPEYTMIEIEEKVISELLERSKYSCPSYIALTVKKSQSCWLKLDLIIYWGVILIAGLMVGGIMILEKLNK
jgi:hypothetical protein